MRPGQGRRGAETWLGRPRHRAVPLQAFYMIRFHSFYPWHTCGDYMHLCSPEDRHMLPWVQEFKCVSLGEEAGKSWVERWGKLRRSCL